MTTVNIATLKNNLSHYLRKVRRGEEVLIRDRTTPVAKLVPLAIAEDFDTELLELAARGIVKLPAKKMDWKKFWAMPRPNIPMEVLVAAVVADREED